VSDSKWGLTLQHLEVLEVGIFGVDVELHARHGDIHEDAVEDLAKGRSVIVRMVGQLRKQRQLLRGRGKQRREMDGWMSEPTYPVPHCSTLVMLSWRRLLSQPRSSCLDRVASSCQPLWFLITCRGGCRLSENLPRFVGHVCLL